MDPLLQRIVEAERLLAAGDLAAATRAAESALLDAPPHAALALNVLGQIAANRSDAQTAILLWETATRAGPTLHQPWVSLGEAMFHLGQPDKAVSCFREALRRAPGLHPLHVHLGIALQAAGKHQDAVDELRRAVGADPSNPEAPVALATSLHALGRSTQAVDALQAAAKLHPNYPKLHANLGVLHEKLGQLEQAIAAYDRALVLSPNDPTTLFNRGSSLIQLLRIDEARRDWETALRLQPPNDPAHANTKSNLAILELLDGNLVKGFDLFEARWAVRHQKFPVPYPEWDGSPLGSKHLLLYVEQGLGDVLQFCRYVPVIKAANPHCRITIATLPTLHPLLKSLQGLDAVTDVHPPYPPADLTLSLLSVPRVLKTTLDTIPANVPYLRPDPALAAQWRKRLDALLPPGKQRIGLFWRGTQVDPNRTIKLAELAPLFDAAPDVQFISLQKGEGEEELAHFPHPITPIGQDLLTYADTAAVLSHLDLIITIDTSLAHAAGALGRPVWTLLPYRPDWRWLMYRTDSPWYPTMRLFRQRGRGDWSETVNVATRGVANNRQVDAG